MTIDGEPSGPGSSEPFDSDLKRLLGEVALNDAENDEWLVQILAALLRPHEKDVVTVLVAGDSLSVKADKIDRILKLQCYTCSPVGAQHRDPTDILKLAKTLKAERDAALHSFYAVIDDDSNAFQAFRSRSGPREVSGESLSELIKRQEGLRDELIALTRQIEHQLADGQGSADTIALLTVDTLELLALSRLRVHPDFKNLIDAFVSDGKVVVGLGRYGRWRLLSAGAMPDDDWPWLAHINSVNGAISIADRFGRTFEGIDTGWRNVTELVQTELPDVELAMLRRLHSIVSYAQEGGADAFDPVIYAPDRLRDRVFGVSEPAMQLPKVIRDLDGFGSGVPPE